MNKNNLLGLSESGQGGLFISALITMLAITFLGVSLSGMSVINARRGVSTNYTSQQYYIANAGVQEALASRFTPRTNYLNFLNYVGANNTNPPAFNAPLYGFSGLVFKDPTTRNINQLLGVYRYVVLGGRGGADITTGELSQEFMTSNQINQHFYVLSKGSLCLHKKSKAIGVGIIRVVSAGGVPVPQCSDNDYELDHLTLLTEANLARDNNPNYDAIAGYRIYKEDQNIVLPTPIALPDGNMISSVNFENSWSVGGLAPFKPIKVAFYNMSDDKPELEKIIDISGATTNVPATTEIDERTVIRVFFNKAFDHRTIYVDPKNTEAIAECTGGGADLEDCNLRLRELNANGTSEELFSKMTIFPAMPSSTMVTLLPSLNTGDTLESGKTYQLEFDPEVSDWYGNTLEESQSNGYKIQFQTKK